MPDLEPTSPDAPGQLQKLEEFETALLQALDSVGLPSDGVLVEMEQRHRVFSNFAGAISLLDESQLQKSMYLSKLLAAVGAGLFDAALNYLWDETIGELRRRIALYDLAYFFDIAVSSPDRRKGLRDEADLSQISDQELIRASRDIGLISDIGYQQLDLIRYMRNYASAAHPNQNEINAYQLLGWVETCIKEVITLPESHLVAETRRLLHNVRDGAITGTNAAVTAEFFAELPAEPADNLAAGFFGIYADPGSHETARDSVRLLMPHLWPHVSDKQRNSFGVKYAKYIANADTARAEKARELLDVVGGAAYLPEQVRSAEISVGVDDLLAAHRGFNNFYTEPGPARRLDTLSAEPVPTSVTEPYVAAIVEVFLTNGSGVARSADMYYASMISRFGPREAEVALLQLFDPTISSKLRWATGKAKFAELLGALESKVTKAAARDLLDGIKAFTAEPDKVAKDSGLQRLAERLH